MTSGKMDVYGNNLCNSDILAGTQQTPSYISAHIRHQKKKRKKESATQPTSAQPKWSEKIEWEGKVEEVKEKGWELMGSL